MSFARQLVGVTVSAAAGASLKLADSLGESESRNLKAYVTAVISGALMGAIMQFGVQESSYALGIIAGVAFGGKINRPNLLLGLLAVAATGLVLGLPSPIPWLLVIVTVLSLTDELGHDRFGRHTDLAGFLFKYRLGLKSGTIFLAVTSLISVTTAVSFFAFDLAYDATSSLIAKT